MVKKPEQFYKEIGATGLAARKRKLQHRRELAYLKKLLNKNQKILDLACGYGRFTIPLSKKGYDIEGLDISSNLIKDAKTAAKKEGLKIKFKIGDMRNLPYKNNTFDVILVMWSAFTELHKKSEQMKALKNMFRILKEGGWALLDLPYNIKYKKSVTIGEDEFWTKGNITYSKLSGIESMPTYLYTKKHLNELMKILKPKKYKIFVEKFGGKDRLFLKFWK